jgi:hypothetical protein
MSKCLYTEADVTQSGAQLIICSTSLDGQTSSLREKHFRRAFPAAWEVADKMLSIKVDEAESARLGDVIWAQPGGNRHIGFCIVKENDSDVVHKDAVALAMTSAKNKARELNIQYVGMDLFASESGKDWADIVGVVEENLEEIQGVVCIPTNRQLNAVLSNLPGSKDFIMTTVK